MIGSIFPIRHRGDGIIRGFNGERPPVRRHPHRGRLPAYALSATIVHRREIALRIPSRPLERPEGLILPRLSKKLLLSIFKLLAGLFAGKVAPARRFSAHLLLYL